MNLGKMKVLQVLSRVTLEEGIRCEVDMIHSLSMSVLPCTLGTIKCAHLRQTYRSTSSVPYGGGRIYLCVAWMSQGRFFSAMVASAEREVEGLSDHHHNL